MLERQTRRCARARRPAPSGVGGSLTSRASNTMKCGLSAPSVPPDITKQASTGAPLPLSERVVQRARGEAAREIVDAAVALGLAHHRDDASGHDLAEANPASSAETSSGALALEAMHDRPAASWQARDHGLRVGDGAEHAALHRHHLDRGEMVAVIGGGAGVRDAAGTRNRDRWPRASSCARRRRW